ncbi:hypothetical protein Acsp04_16540 [Actinomadura sp. NBRC 104425]|nr:hypothetical protein Acsp04_16540 [Actinomadura sp. NBRC 104425]
MFPRRKGDPVFPAGAGERGRLRARFGRSTPDQDAHIVGMARAIIAFAVAADREWPPNMARPAGKSIGRVTYPSPVRSMA